MNGTLQEVFDAEEPGEVESDPEQEMEKLIESFCPGDRDKAFRLVDVARRPKRRRKSLPKEGQENWVTLRSIFKTAKVPETVAKVIEDALKVMLLDGDITEHTRFQALEYWAAEYIAEHGVAE